MRVSGAITTRFERFRAPKTAGSYRLIPKPNPTPPPGYSSAWGSTGVGGGFRWHVAPPRGTGRGVECQVKRGLRVVAGSVGR
ncbi:hypothetical protein GCM10017586_23110 [Microbacterium imperiale]|uniref:Uncharacterized protein n=1 Tax=Microbacterium imperiale TaxID=33884 RepID=A0A9W6HID0_9MICO|nr:hypothetical protein GCM10017544_26330 [Microbacterium imperiale]GLJ80628.1 hypothetical protein GCM10017586_23110 [Microbacterium imperiale]